MSDPKSLLSSLQAFTAADKLPALSSHSLHLYAPESLQAPWEALQELAVTAEALADGLQQNAQVPSEAKTIALLKQYMSETSALFSVRLEVVVSISYLIQSSGWSGHAATRPGSSAKKHGSIWGGYPSTPESRPRLVH
jgi:hypothetical protein